MAERRRWDGDERFTGVADAGSATADVERLLALTRESGWVTEDPELHLGPWCLAAAASLDLEVLRLEVVDHVLEVDVRSIAAEADVGAGRVAAYGLVGAFAEASTHIREHRNADRSEVVLDIVTGILPDNGSFATHGHLVRVRLLTPVD
jgi:hypothetical protein